MSGSRSISPGTVYFSTSYLLGAALNPSVVEAIWMRFLILEVESILNVAETSRGCVSQLGGDGDSSWHMAHREPWGGRVLSHLPVYP